MHQSPTVRRNGSRASVTVWGPSPDADSAMRALVPTLAPGERAALVDQRGATFRYLIATT